MNPLEISVIAFAVVFASMLLGMFLRRRLPEHHLNDESREVIKLGAGVIATMAALALGLLINSAKGTFDTINSGLRLTGSKIILLDHTLDLYGPETKEARAVLRRSIARAIEQIWVKPKGGTVSVANARQERGLDELSQTLRQLSPQNDQQRRLQFLALTTTDDIAETRLLIMEHLGQSSFPMPLLVLLILWLGIIFFSFGMLSPGNATVNIILFVCALSAASALYLILELDQPFGGVIKVSSGPVQTALTYLGQD